MSTRHSTNPRATNGKCSRPIMHWMLATSKRQMLTCPLRLYISSKHPWVQGRQSFKVARWKSKVFFRGNKFLITWWVDPCSCRYSASFTRWSWFTENTMAKKILLGGPCRTPPMHWRRTMRPWKRDWFPWCRIGKSGVTVSLRSKSIPPRDIPESFAWKTVWGMIATASGSIHQETTMVMSGWTSPSCRRTFASIMSACSLFMSWYQCWSPLQVKYVWFLATKECQSCHLSKAFLRRPSKWGPSPLGWLAKCRIGSTRMPMAIYVTQTARKMTFSLSGWGPGWPMSSNRLKSKRKILSQMARRRLFRLQRPRVQIAGEKLRHNVCGIFLSFFEDNLAEFRVSELNRTYGLQGPVLQTGAGRNLRPPWAYNYGAGLCGLYSFKNIYRFRKDAVNSGDAFTVRFEWTPTLWSGSRALAMIELVWGVAGSYGPT